jgi:hypothetical protein
MHHSTTTTTTTSSSSEPGDHRQSLLRNFALSATTRPLNRTAIAHARQELLKQLGPETLVEACGVIGLFECFTKFVDATGKKANPVTMQSVMTFVLSVQTWMYGILSWLYPSW